MRTKIWIIASAAWTSLGEACIRVGRWCARKAAERRGFCLSCLLVIALILGAVGWFVARG